MRTELYEGLRAASERDALPAVTAYNRIDGPGSSLDLREFQQALWSLPRIPVDHPADPAAIWTKHLPRTVGITIDVGIRVEARPFKPGLIAVRSHDYGTNVVGQPGRVHPSKENWLLKIIEIFGLSGVEFALRNTHPGLKSCGLGGSATATTAVCILANELAGRPFGPIQLVALASRMEQDLGVSITGTQEQSNVVFGGVTDYVWFPWGVPGCPDTGYGHSIRYELIPKKNFPELEQRMAIFHTGDDRASTDVNAVWTKLLGSKKGYSLHQQKLELAYHFREGLRLHDWRRAIAATEDYRSIRTKLCSAYMKGADKMMRVAKSFGGTAFPLGAGGGGAVLILAPDGKASQTIRDRLAKTHREIPYKMRCRGYESENTEEGTK